MPRNPVRTIPETDETVDSIREWFQALVEFDARPVSHCVCADVSCLLEKHASISSGTFDILIDRLVMILSLIHI